MVRLSDHPDMTIAVDWDIKSQTKQNQIHYTTQRTYLNEGSTTSFLVNPQEAVITKDSIATVVFPQRHAPFLKLHKMPYILVKNHENLTKTKQVTDFSV